MTRFRNNLSYLIERQSDLEVTIGDYASYPVIGSGTTYLKLESSMSLQLSDVLHVPGIKKEFRISLCIRCKGYERAFAKRKSTCLA